MAKKVSITRKQLMAMKEPDFYAFVEANGYGVPVGAIAARNTAQDVYPRIKVPNTKENAKTKFVYIADKSKPPVKKMKRITFFEVKCAFADEVLHLPYAEKKKKETFHDRLIALANSSN